MKKMMLILTFSLTGFVQAQNNLISKYDDAKNTVYLELGGIGKAMYSVNYERLMFYSDPFTLALKAGVMFPSTSSQDAFNDEYVYPVELNFRTWDEGVLEFGIGQVFTPGKEPLSTQAPPYLRCGVRAQNEEGGLMFRIALVENLLNQTFKPRLAFSLGYSF